MDKITIIANHSEADDNLIQCFSMLFPDCEIQIQYKGSEDARDRPVIPESTPIHHHNHGFK